MGKPDSKKKEKTQVGSYLFRFLICMAHIFFRFNLFPEFITVANLNAVNNVEKFFSGLLNKDKSLSAGIAAIKTLLMVLENTKCEYCNKPNKCPDVRISISS